MRVEEMREWYIKLNDLEEGPFSIEELKKDRRITPETMVRKKGFAQWQPIGEVKELKEIFQDESEPEPEPDEAEENSLKKSFDDQITLSAQSDPGNFILWVIIILLILIWLFQRLPN
jgi:hypothetical protein